MFLVFTERPEAPNAVVGASLYWKRVTTQIGAGGTGRLRQRREPPSIAQRLWTAGGRAGTAVTVPSAPPPGVPRTGSQALGRYADHR